MKTLILGGGDLAASISGVLAPFSNLDAPVLQKKDCDVTSYATVVATLEREKPDWVVCTAGLSDRVIGVNIRMVVEANLIGPMNVGTACAALGIPCVLIASTAGMTPGAHKWYGPAKAGVINFVEAMARSGHRIWAVSPGRMDTRMRQADFPNEDPATRLSTGQVATVVADVIHGYYAPGANVVIRKVGLDRVDTFEAVNPWKNLPSLLD